jgi:hypothetical protein
VDKEALQRLLRKAFSDISRGYSVAFFKGEKLFIKHLSHHEQVDLDVIHKTFKEEGVREGLPTEQYMLEQLEKEGVWTKKDDEELESFNKTIERLVMGKKIIYLKSELDRQNKYIEEEQNKFYKKKSQKDRLLGLTAEAFAEKKVNEHYIVESFYLDANFQKRYLSDDYFDNLSEHQMQEIVALYNTEIDVVSDKNIKRLAIQDFFQAYWSLSAENLYNFFGKPICDLTYFQIKLGSYGRTFKGILEKADTFPEDVREDPDKLLDYVRTGQNAKERMEAASVGSDKEASGDGTVASTLFGAEKEELKAIGLESDPGTTSLSKELKKNAAQGKKGLTMQEMMKLMGV